MDCIICCFHGDKIPQDIEYLPHICSGFIGTGVRGDVNMERVRQLVSAVIAGGLIGMGGTVYLSQQNPVVGSCLFAIG